MIAAPLELYQALVRPEWLDYNGHLNDGYYAVMFSLAAERLLDYIGLYQSYREKTQCSIYTVETHIVYLRELKEAMPVSVTCQVLGFDEKRIQIFQEMRHAEANYLAATNEVLFVHVNQKGIARSAPMPQEAQQLLGDILESHAPLGQPAQAGRSISLRKT
jgi:acyl-CoA thioester hydrolase